jgi:choline monooxygenase
MTLRFPFDANIARASTIPARLYFDPVYFELERDRIFARTWQLAARTEQLQRTGDYVAVEVAGERVVLVRDGEALRGFHNICLHRAGPVAEGCGRRQTLQCRYHGWTYDLTGGLIRAPEMEGVERFSPEDMHLLPVQVAAWGPLVFVNLDRNAPPLAHYLEDIPERASRFDAGRMRYVMRKEYELACNWKVYVDNYLEGYHVPVVHPGLHKELDYDQYRVETFRYYSRQHAPVRPARPGDASRRYLPASPEEEPQYYWLFPNVMLNVYYGQMQTNVVEPLDHQRTRVVFDWYAVEPPADPATDPVWAGMVAFSDEIQIEDVEICEAVQRNLRSRVYDRGRYSAKRENGVHHFHALLHEFLT